MPTETPPTNLPYLIGGYTVFWTLLLGYLWSLRSRYQRLLRERDLLSQPDDR
jgi:CcmD family protein